MRHHARACALALFLAPSAAAQCPSWSSGFRSPGVGGLVSSLASFDPGGGPRLYALGGPLFGTDGSSYRRVLSWNGTDWQQLGGSTTPGEPYNLQSSIAFDDGSGPALYVGGLFSTIGGAAGNGIARWNGSAWSGLSSGANNSVSSLAVFDDGSGPALFAGGSFTTAGGGAANRIAKWNGSGWSALGGGLNGHAAALAVFDDGSGPALYAGGTFTAAGGAPANYVARWDGHNWSPLGSGTNSTVRALLVHDDGSGRALYAAGEFSLAGGSSAIGIARWNGSTWSALAGGLGPSLAKGLALAEFDDGAGTNLYVGGDFQIADGNVADSLARWNGTAWSSVAGGMPGYVKVAALRVFDDGSGRALYAGGDFAGAGGVHSKGIARWNGAAWSAVGAGAGVEGSVRALARHDDGAGTALYAGGSFTWAGAVAAARVARFDGSAWSALGTGVDGSVQALASFDDGSGPRLYAGGQITRAGSVLVGNLASWDGSAWHATGLGTDDTVFALKAFDDGSGNALYVGGEFFHANGALVRGIARWNGTSFATVGAGIYGFVTALEVFDDGTGPALHAGGRLSLDGGAGNSVLRWNGTAWTALAGAFENAQLALASVDLGDGSALYAGGYFTNVSGTPMAHIARWNGSTWSPLGSGVSNYVYSLLGFDDGSGAGPALFVGGSFHAAGGVPAESLARWDGASWSSVGDGVDGSLAFVQALAPFDAGGGTSLFVGGGFEIAGDEPAQSLAEWRGCGWTGRLVCFGDGSGTACPCGNASAVGDRDGCLNSTGLGGRLRASGGPSLAQDTLVLSGTRMTNGAALYFQGTSRVNGGAGAAFGDGLRCAGGTVVRLAIVSNAAGASQFPGAGDPPVSVKGAVAAPGVRLYQIWFRDAQLYCTPSTFDLTNAVEVVWGG